MKNAPSDQTKSILCSKDTSANTQRMQILAHLKATPSISRLEFRELGFISPAQRILELKEYGHNIVSTRESVTTPDGRLHRGIARYYLSNVPPANDPSSEVAA